MADDGRGNPVTGGYNGSGEDIARLIASTLDSNLKSYTAQLRGIFSELHKVVDSSKKSTSEPSRTSRSFERRKMTDIEDMYEDVTSIADVFQKMQKEIQKEHKELFASSEDFKRDLSNLELKDLESLLQKKQLEIAKKYAEAQEENLKQFEQKLREIETRDLDAEQKETLKQLEHKKKIAEKLYSKFLERPNDYAQEQVDRVKEILDNVNKEIQNVYISSDISKKKDSEKAAREYEVKQRKLEEKEREEKENAVPVVAEFDKDALKEAMGAINSAKQQSPYLNELLGDENDGHKKTDFEKFEENKREQLKLLDKASKTLDVYRDKLLQDKANGKITQEQLDEELGVIDKQKENIDRAKQAMEDWTPIRDAMQSATKSLKDSLQNVIKNLAKFAFERLEDKYLKAYQEGFEKVYQSVENTRNQISARSKLDQGGFSEMQDQIQSTIEEQGLENVVAQSDVNEALISLSSAGITNTDMLKTLALEQAKLNASGSSLKLDNEETLQYLQEFIRNQMATGRSYEDALSDVPKLLSNVVANEDAIREQYGHDMALVGGNMNKIFNEALNMANTAGKNLEQTSSDIGAMMNYGEAQFTSGIDSDTLTAFIREIRDGNIAGVSNFGKILEVNGLTPDQVIEQPLEKTLATINETLDDALANKSDFYIKEVLDAYGISMDRMTALKYKKGLDVKEVSDEDVERLKLERQQANQQGTYYSATQNYQKQAENSMAEIAIGAEKLYKGNVFVEEGFKEVTGLLGSIEDAVLSIGETAIKNGLGNTVGSFFGSRTGSGGTNGNGGGAGQGGLANILSNQNVTDFMKGTRGTTAGTVGRVAGGVVGAGMVGYSVVSHIADREGGEPALETINDIAQDSTAWSGIGTAIGSAVGGPIAGAVVGGLMGGASKLGAAWGDHIATKLDPFQEAVKSFKEETEKKLNNDIDEYNTMQQTLNKYRDAFEKNNQDEMKMLLLEKGNIDDKDLMNKDEAEIQELFKKNLLDDAENLAKQKELQIMQEDILNKNSQTQAEINQDWRGSALRQFNADYVDLNEEEQQEFIDRNINQFVGQSKDVIKDVGRQITELQSMSDKDIDTYLVSMGVDPSSVSGKSLDEKKALISEVFLEKYKDTAGITDEIEALFDVGMQQYNSRKKVYEDATQQLQKQWDTASSNVKSSLGTENPNMSDIIVEYMKLYHSDDNKNWRDLKDIVINDDGTVSLDPGEMYRDSYSFKTGLTEVPVDEYPALLHEGERVLTKEEAEAYNLISSQAIKSVFGNEKSIVDSKTLEQIKDAVEQNGVADVSIDNIIDSFAIPSDRRSVINNRKNADTVNTISSYILSNLEDHIYNNTSASNVFSTRQYGTDNVEKSIDNQTNSLSELLEQILEAIKGLGISLSLKSNNSMSAAKYNVIKGNSNVTQLNTL